MHSVIRYFLCFLLPLGLSAQATPLQLPVVQSSPVYYSVFNHLTPNATPYHPVLHFGTPPDTIDTFVGYVYPPLESMPGPRCVNRNPADFRQPFPNDLAVHVYPNDTIEMMDLSYGQDSMTFYKAIPVIVANNSLDSLVIGTAPQQEVPMGHFIQVGIVLEGKDDNGEWRALEAAVMPSGTDNALVLPGRQIAVTAVYLYKGPFETDLRLRLGEAVSETYRGWINPAAFR